MSLIKCQHWPSDRQVLDPNVREHTIVCNIYFPLATTSGRAQRSADNVQTRLLFFIFLFQNSSATGQRLKRTDKHLYTGQQEVRDSNQVEHMRQSRQGAHKHTHSGRQGDADRAVRW